MYIKYLNRRLYENRKQKGAKNRKKVPKDEDLTLVEKFEAIKPFTSDEDSTVREYTCEIMRENILENLGESIAILSNGVKKKVQT